MNPRTVHWPTKEPSKTESEKTPKKQPVKGCQNVLKSIARVPLILLYLVRVTVSTSQWRKSRTSLSIIIIVIIIVIVGQTYIIYVNNLLLLFYLARVLLLLLLIPREMVGIRFFFLRRFAADERETQTTARSEAKAQTESRTGSDAIENTRSCDAHSVAVAVGVAAVDDGVSFVTCKERERQEERERESAWVSWRLPPSAYQFHCTLSLALRVVVFTPSLWLSISRSLIAPLVRRWLEIGI